MTDRIDAEGHPTGFELGNGDYIICDTTNADAWLRSDSVVDLDARSVGQTDDSTSPRS